MQTNNPYPNRFQQYAAGNQAPKATRKMAPRRLTPQPQPAMAYVYQPGPELLGQMILPATAPAQQAASKGFLGRLKDGLYNLVMEESSAQRPIGISQLTRKTFNVRQEVAHRSAFRNGQMMQDYRFSQLTK